MVDNLKVDKKALNEKLKERGIESLQESNILGEVYIMLSLECNLKCDFCVWWGRVGPCRDTAFLKQYSPVLTLKELKRFADDIVDFNPRMITFSGGEPLLYKRWYLLAKYFKKKGVKVSITTNGILLNDNFAEIIDTVDQVNISLGGSAVFVSQVTESSPAYFQKIWKGLRKLAKFKRDNKDIPWVQLLYTISDISYGHMESLIKFMETRGIAVDRYTFQHLMFINKDAFKRQKMVFAKEFGIDCIDFWKGFTSSPSKINFSKFKQEIKRVKSLANVSFHPDLYDDELESYYNCNSGISFYLSYCTAPWHQVNVLPNGNIYICPDYFIGNIKKSSFKMIWNGEEIEKLRAYLTRSLFPGCKGCFYYYCDNRRRK